MNQNEFQQKIKSSEKPTVVDFWAPWCGPCRITKPILEKLGKEYGDSVQFLAINADEAPEVIEEYRVFGIPTVITFRNGSEVGRITGAQSEAGFRAMFQALANGDEINVPITPFDRMLRLGAGGLFLAVGVVNSNWLVAGIGAVLAFLGVYDRCPIWKALTKSFQRK